MKQKKGVFLKGVDVPQDVNRIMGHDADGYYVLDRVMYHTDGTPDEWEKTYYTPFEVACGMKVRQILLDDTIPEMLGKRGEKDGNE